MFLTTNDKKKLTCLIIRFLKEQNLYYTFNLRKSYDYENVYVTYRSPLTDIKVETLERSMFFENTLTQFTSLYMKIGADIKLQLKYTKFLKNYLRYDTEILFNFFLQKKGIKFEQLERELDGLRMSGIISFNNFVLRKEIIYDYKPHIMSALKAFLPYNSMVVNCISFNSLYNEWESFYNEHQKLK